MAGYAWLGTGTSPGYLQTTLLAGCLTVLPALAETRPSPAAGQEMLTGTDGREVRMIWAESESADPLAGGRTLSLMAWESGTPSVIRPLLAAPGNVSRPLLTGDGQTIIFTDRKASDAGGGMQSYEPEIFAIPFAGGTPRSLGPGFAVAVQPGPEGQPEYIYALSTLQTARRSTLTGDRLVRFRIATPNDREIVWASTPLAADSVQLSRDGARVCGLFPWPKAGLGDMTTQTFHQWGHGAMPSLAPDDSYAMSVLDGTRKRLRIFVPGVTPGWELAAGDLPEMGGGAIQHPRWSNDVRWMTWTGPYTESVSRGGVWAVRLRNDLRKVERVTRITAPDFTGAAMYPDLWISGGGTQKSDLVQQPAIEAAAPAGTWPGDSEGLVFACENAASPGIALHGMARPGNFSAIHLGNGWATAPEETATRISTACRASGAWSLEAAITESRFLPPVSARLISLRDATGRDLVSLYRVNRNLVLRTTLGSGANVRTEPVILTQMAVEEGRPFFLTLTYKTGTLTLFLGGQVIKEWKLPNGSLESWQATSLQLGDTTPYGEPWSGTLERVAFYSRALVPEEIRQSTTRTQEAFSLRTQPSASAIQARLIEMPAPSAAGEARQGLSAAAWEVVDTRTGPIINTKKIAILHWSVLDGKAVSMPPATPGQNMEIRISPLEEHPELEGILTQNQLGDGELPLYLDLTVPGRHTPAYADPNSTPAPK